VGAGHRNANTNWFYISKGKFYTGKGDDKQEYDYLEGNLVDLSFEDEEFDGKKFRKAVIVLDDGELTMKFSTKVGDGYGRQILGKLPNCDLSEPVQISLTYSEEGGKKNSGAFVSQGRENIKQMWTKDHPNGCPDLKVVEIDDKKIYSSKDRDAWIENYFMTNVIPKFKKPSKPTSNSSDFGDDNGEEAPF